MYSKDNGIGGMCQRDNNPNKAQKTAQATNGYTSLGNNTAQGGGLKLNDLPVSNSFCFSKLNMFDTNPLLHLRFHTETSLE